MNTVGIAILSLLAGMFLLTLLGALVVTIYYARGVKTEAEKLQHQVAAFYAETGGILQEHRALFGQIAESAKSNLTTTRQEMRSALEAHVKQVEVVLAEHQRKMDAVADKINATQLLEASKMAVVACKRVEKAAEWILRLRADIQEGVGMTGEPWPEERAEEYAPEDAPTIYAHARAETVAGMEGNEDRLPTGL